MIHELPLDAANLHGAFSRELEPTLTIDAGDSVRISVPGFRWETAAGVTFAPVDPERSTGWSTCSSASAA